MSSIKLPGELSLLVPILAHHAVPLLLIFFSVLESEHGFSAFMTTIFKSRSRLAAPGHNFRCAVSSLATL